jgi:hypothetical protein
MERLTSASGAAAAKDTTAGINGGTISHRVNNTYDPASKRTAEATSVTTWLIVS